MRDFLRLYCPTLLCFICSTSIFFVMCARLAVRHDELVARIYKLNEQKNRALELNDELKAMQKCQNDVDFLELLMMKKLGVVAQGYKKVLFIPKEES